MKRIHPHPACAAATRLGRGLLFPRVSRAAYVALALALYFLPHALAMAQERHSLGSPSGSPLANMTRELRIDLLALAFLALVQAGLYYPMLRLGHGLRVSFPSFFTICACIGLAPNILNLEYQFLPLDFVLDHTLGVTLAHWAVGFVMSWHWAAWGLGLATGRDAGTCVAAGLAFLLAMNWCFMFSLVLYGTLILK